jgi:putative alpha-1,2-mannosidase
LVKQILDKHFTNSPGGIPGNDDTGTMSTWALMNMMGIYPFCPGRPDYTIVTPVFDKVTIQLDKKYYPKSDPVTIRRQKEGNGEFIKKTIVDGKPLGGFKISHQVLVNSKDILIVTGDR